MHRNVTPNPSSLDQILLSTLKSPMPKFCYSAGRIQAPRYQTNGHRLPNQNPDGANLHLNTNSKTTTSERRPLTLLSLLRRHDGAPGPPLRDRRGGEAAAGLGAERLRPRRRCQPAQREPAPLRGEDLRETRGRT